MEAIIISKEEFNSLIEKINLLSKKVEKIGEASTSNKWLTIDETCTYLSVSKRTLQTYRDNGVLPFSQYSNKVYFKLSDIELFLLSNYNKLETAGKSSSFHSKNQRA